MVSRERSRNRAPFGDRAPYTARRSWKGWATQDHKRCPCVRPRRDPRRHRRVSDRRRQRPRVPQILLGTTSAYLLGMFYFGSFIAVASLVRGSVVSGSINRSKIIQWNIVDISYSKEYNRRFELFPSTSGVCTQKPSPDLESQQRHST